MSCVSGNLALPVCEGNRVDLKKKSTHKTKTKYPQFKQCDDTDGKQAGSRDLMLAVGQLPTLYATDRWHIR